LILDFCDYIDFDKIVRINQKILTFIIYNFFLDKFENPHFYHIKRENNYLIEIQVNVGVNLA